MSTDPAVASPLKQDLPDDVVLQILSRLPVRALVKFSCVCKSWYALLQNPIFIKQHSDHHFASVDNDYYLLTYYRRPIDTTEFSSLCKKTRKITPLLGLTSPGQLQVVSSCNGLVCVTDMKTYTFGNSFMLFNPARQEHYVVPVYHPPESYLDAHPRNAVLGVCVGFGFDTENKDYKIVRITNMFMALNENVFTYVDVYSCNKNSWKRAIVDTDQVTVLRTCLLEQVGLIFKNSFFFFADRRVIVSFDLSNETFTIIHETSPRFVQPKLCYFDVWEDHLAIVCYYDRQRAYCHTYVPDDYIMFYGNYDDSDDHYPSDRDQGQGDNDLGDDDSVGNQGDNIPGYDRHTNEYPSDDAVGDPGDDINANLDDDDDDFNYDPNLDPDLGGIGFAWCNFYRNDDDDRIDVWIMRGNSSWTKEYSCRHNQGRRTLQLSRRLNNNDFLLFCRKTDRFHVYDKATNTIEVLDIPDWYVRTITGYKESLITMKREEN